MDIQIWNSLEKPDNINEEAVEGDILEKIDGVLFLLQTTNGYNNVIAYRVEPLKKLIIRTFLEYCMMIYDRYGIEFIRVEGDKGKYAFLKRIFKSKEVVKDKSIKSRDVYYCNLKEAREHIELKLKEMDFYSIQNLYLTTDSEEVKKKCFDGMFMMVRFAVETAIKLRLGKLATMGVKRNDLYDLIMNATLKIMSRYKKPNGYRIEYLLTTADYAALGVLHNKRQQFWDSQISYEGWLEYKYNEKEM